MKILKKVFKIIGLLIILILVLIGISIKPIDRTPYKETKHYKDWKNISNNLNFEVSETDSVQVSWAKVNITPPYTMPMAGYGKRKGEHFSSVHDSIYVRSIALKISSQIHYYVSLDMLIMPPSILAKLKPSLKQKGINWENIHFSATHTHNSVGGWGNTLTGQAFAGKYDDKIEDFIANKIMDVISKSSTEYEYCTLEYGEILDNKHIKNRLDIKDGQVDTEIRTIKFTKKSGKIAQLISYGAHSTVLNSSTMNLSRDYSGVLLDSLERNIDFGMYMAGAVGSMGPIENGKDDFDEVKNQGLGVLDNLQRVNFSITKGKFLTKTIEIPIAAASPKISQNWALRPFMFKYLFGDYPTFIKVSRIGNVLIIGTPCDFSGELMITLDKYAKSKGLDLMITSFNGSYIGYITDDRLYDLDLYETRVMNWFGFQNGAYFSEIIRDIIDKQ